jgi:hypothetical protein
VKEKKQYLQGKPGLVVLPNIFYTGVILKRHIATDKRRGHSSIRRSSKREKCGCEGGYSEEGEKESKTKTDVLPEWDDALL